MSKNITKVYRFTYKTGMGDIYLLKRKYKPVLYLCVGRLHYFFSIQERKDIWVTVSTEPFRNAYKMTFRQHNFMHTLDDKHDIHLHYSVEEELMESFPGITTLYVGVHYEI